ncbi:hypothetical protein HK100_005916 [Physocladia obscura]|uniref:Impact N-terminal domain-containing protein n=1 Tax=Physocladia obscura TaxID=109957 RepID=A0AAD5T639_9FUNG|nr:hypothetical protein HK100_005916 [Physocladia obscura]
MKRRLTPTTQPSEAELAVSKRQREGLPGSELGNDRSADNSVSNSYNNNAFAHLMQSNTARQKSLAASAPALTAAPAKIVDRLSVFVAHAAHVTSQRDVAALKAFIALPPPTATGTNKNTPFNKHASAPNKQTNFTTATHNITAWRFLVKRTGCSGNNPDDYRVQDGYEDDGETGAGRKLWTAMCELGACDCFVVVSRWYGGTNLGPVRFDHISNVAISALEAAGFINNNNQKLTQPEAQQSLQLQENRQQTAVAPNWKSNLDFERVTRLLKARTASIQGFAKSIALTRVQYMQNSHTIDILSSSTKKARSSSINFEYLPPSDISMTQEKLSHVCNLGQDASELLLDERNGQLAEAKLKLAQLKELISKQEMEIQELSYAVASKSAKKTE